MKKSIVHHQEIQCSYCKGNDLQKNGKSVSGAQRWFCKGLYMKFIPNFSVWSGAQRWFCKGSKKYFQLDYRYNAYKPGIKEKIIEMTLNSSGVRDIGRVLLISKDTVTAVLKKKR